MRSPFLSTPSLLRNLALLATGAALFAAGTARANRGTAVATPSGSSGSYEQTAFVKRYCASCHTGKQAGAGIELGRLAVAHPEQNAPTWERALVQLRAGMMPPAGAPRPTEAQQRAFIAFIETGIDKEAALHPNPGRPLLHRLNRTEYANSVRDLLDIDLDVTELLPPDDMSHGFDNMAEVLKVSPTLLAGYIRAAGKISRIAIGERKATPAEEIYHLPSTLSQTRHIEGTPLGTRGGIVIRHNFPADGEYIFKSTLYFTTNTFLFGMYQKGEQLEVAVNGERVGLFDVNPMMKVDDDLRTPPIKIKAGPQTVTVAFVEKASGPVEDFVQPFDHSLGDLFLGRTAGLTGLPHVRDVAIDGPFHVTGISATPSRNRIFTQRPQSPSDERRCAQAILNRLARLAYRRPITATDTANLMQMYDQGHEKDGFEEGVRQGLQYILANPQFVFRFERPPVQVSNRLLSSSRPTGLSSNLSSNLSSYVLSSGINYRLSDLEIASRLSYFLWSSGPDAQLLDLASQGKLKNPVVLEREVRRMLADPRSQALAANFAGQWLHLRNLKDAQPDLFAFPNFNHNLLVSMQRETELFFASIVHEDRDVDELLTADYTFVDENLARHYAIPDVEGTRFRRVKLTDPNRRGLLGQGSILTVTSFANRTSPVVRGKWIMDNLLGAPPPQPPANVPPLTEITEGATPHTVRDRLEAHRKNPACASCHTKMDPIGFALENFDATGRWRTRDNGYRLDARGQLVDGTHLDGPASLRNALVSRSDAFRTTFTQKLLTYALGRGTEYYDMPAVRTILRQTAHRDNRFSAYVLAIVQSVPFQLRRSENQTQQGTNKGSNYVHNKKTSLPTCRPARYGCIARPAPAGLHGGSANPAT